MERSIIFVGSIFICLSLASGQEIKLCPNGGPLHLPPLGCALRKNLAPEQNCYTIAVVCNEGRAIVTTGTPVPVPEPEPKGHLTCPPRQAEVTPNPAACDRNLKNCSDDSDCGKSELCCVDEDCGGTFCKKGLGGGSASTGNPEATTPAASIDSSAQQVDKLEGYCSIFKDNDTAQCDAGQRECTQGSDCGVVEVCCQDVACKKKVCKTKILPCPPGDPIPSECALKVVIDRENNCIKEIGECPPGVTSGTQGGTSGTQAVTSATPGQTSATPGQTSGTPTGTTPTTPGATSATPGGTIGDYWTTTATSPAGSTGSGQEASTPAASIDTSGQQIDKLDGTCPVYNETDASQCDAGQRDCTQGSDCGIIEVCCLDVACKKKVCKTRLLPCPPSDEQIPKECTQKTVFDRENNCIKTIGDCPPGVTSGGTTGTQAVTSATPAGTTPIEASTTPAGTTGGTEATSQGSTAGGLGTTIAASIDTSGQQIDKTVPFCPVYNTSTPTECDAVALHGCAHDTDCGVTEMCCQDELCKKKVCRAKLLPCPNNEPPILGVCIPTSTSTTVDRVRNCIMTDWICPRGGGSGGGVTPEGTSATVTGGSSATPTEGTTGTPTSGTPGSSATPTEGTTGAPSAGTSETPSGSSGTPTEGTTGTPTAGTGTSGTPSGSSATPSDTGTPSAGTTVATTPEGSPASSTPLGVTTLQSILASSAGINSDAVRPGGNSDATNKGTCPARDPDAKPNPSSCDKNQKKCNDDSECAANELCCADDDCEATVCKKASKSDIKGDAAAAEPTTTHRPQALAFADAAPVATVQSEILKVSPGSCPPRDRDAQLCILQNWKNCSDDSQCPTGELCCIDECGGAVGTFCKKAVVQESHSIEGVRNMTHEGANDNSTVDTIPGVLPLPIGGEIAPIPVNLPGNVVPPIKNDANKASIPPAQQGSTTAAASNDASQQHATKAPVTNDNSSNVAGTGDSSVPAVLPLPIGGEVAPIPINLPADIVPPIKNHANKSSIAPTSAQQGSTTAAASIDGSQQSATKAPVTNDTVDSSVSAVLPLPIGGEVAPVPINLPSGVVSPVFPGPDIVVPSIRQHTGEAVSSLEKPLRVCPVRNKTVTPNPENCPKPVTTCTEDSQCAIYEACCADDDCGRTICKASLLPCQSDDKPVVCTQKPEVDQERNCVKPVCA